MKSYFASFAFIILLFVLVISSCKTSQNKQETEVCQWVDPFIGTGGHGHTYPGATLPFGMVQLSPDTRLTGWDGCSGYHYSDSVIYGFSHTHLSGTGVSDYGDILFMPTTGKIQLQNGAGSSPDSGYCSRFSHQNEKASPGFYQVFLSDYQVDVKLTATKRVGFHSYTFSGNSQPNIIVDLQHRDPVIESEIRIVNQTEIEGYRRSTNWALDKRIYFVARFSKPFKTHGISSDNLVKENILSATGKNLKAYFRFDSSANEEILVKVAISAVSTEGARKNLDAELPGWDFEKVSEAAHETWNKTLSKIEVEGGSDAQKVNFYTALYHSCLSPNLYQDVDGSYRGMDKKIHIANDFGYYTVFSLWDTYRTLYPLMTILEPEKTNDFVRTLIEKYRESGELPMWELASNDTRCMIGYHAVSVIADAYLKGINNFNTELAWEAMKHSSNVDKRGLTYYREQGFVPADKSSQSVSKTLEYAYDDWCIAQFAKALGKTDDYENYIRRAQFYKNVFDRQTGFMRGRSSDRQWISPFDPQKVNYVYTEGNSYQYLYVPQDVGGLINLMGGEDKFTAWLDALFTTTLTEKLEEDTDVTGLIGQYAHGNEPSHHIVYLFAYAGQSWKTQKYVRQIMDEMYSPASDGLCGNEDCGQMSAWYVMSAMGFYPVCPGQQQYVLGSPLFSKITLHPDNCKKFIIKAENNSVENKYIASAKFNNENFTHSFITHNDILNGGNLELKMSANPNKTFGFPTEDRPVTLIPEQATGISYIVGNQTDFLDSLEIELASESKDADIYFTTDLSIPTVQSEKYRKAFRIKSTTNLTVRSFSPGLVPGYIVSRELRKAAEPLALKSDEILPGLTFDYFEGVFRSLWDFEKESPEMSGTCNSFEFPAGHRDEWFGITFKGLIKIDKDGSYTFFMNADDGGQLKIDGRELCESDGRKSFPFEQQATVNITKGWHKIEVKYFQCSGNKTLELSWLGPEFKRQPIPQNVFSHLR